MIHTGVVHGRFQVLHNDHMRYLLAGKERCRHLVVGITNPDPSLTGEDDADPHRSRPEHNPLTYFERYVLVRHALREAGVPEQDFSVVPLPINRPDLLPYYVPRRSIFYLTVYDDWGRRKKDILTSLGLSVEILWERPADRKGLTASEVRRRMAAGEDWQAMVPPAVADLLVEWDIPARLASGAS